MELLARSMTDDGYSGVTIGNYCRAIKTLINDGLITRYRKIFLSCDSLGEYLDVVSEFCNQPDIKEQNEKLLSEIKKLKSGMPTLECDVNHNITIVGGKSGKYTDGVYIESFDGKYGQIFKFSINLKRFSQNNRVPPKGYIYFEEKKSQAGKYYATPQKFFNQNM